MIVEDEKYLTSEDDIYNYFEDEYYDYFDCGQGYFQNEAEIFVKIGDKYFEVTLKAEIGSAKQDRGDRRYWPEELTSVTYIPIPYSKVMNDCNKSLLVEIGRLENKIDKLKKKMLK